MARFAVKTPTHHTTWDRMLEIWRAADEMDVYESAWNFDHFYPIRGDSDGPCLEAWVTLSALAQATNRIRVGTMVNGMHYRHPAVTAAMASSLDIVSGGRLELGLGAGWYELESDAYGIELGTIGERMTRFEEGTEVIHLLLTQEHTDFEGKFFRLDNARNEPKPVQQPRPPIVIGGKGEKRTLRLVARFASMWDAMFVEDQKDEWLRLREVMWGHCQDVGRDPTEIACSSHLSIAPDPDPGEVAQRAATMFDTGIDVVILGFTAAHDGGTVESIATAIAELN
ncbi:MAG TPA: LLM class F420-dependent oxidoreductase [Acidimicrobiia bacterium]|jgi:F420-dependent oxidoreductase-like protein|nr:LLM class F420-dependent oxidoreductase [Acidimicrobiia bacterium]